MMVSFWFEKFIDKKDKRKGGKGKELGKFESGKIGVQGLLPEEGWQDSVCVCVALE